MNTNLDFSLPDHKDKTDRKGNRSLLIIMSVILLAVMANLFFNIFGYPGTGTDISTQGVHTDRLKQIALKMEKQGLMDYAARAWNDYMSSSGESAEEKARIWYRIGKMYQEGGSFEAALDAYYRSEAMAQPKDISEETGKRIQECLESLGKFAALNYELRERVGAEAPGDATNDPVVAEIGNYRIHKSEIDKKIEGMIETQLSRMAPYASEEQLRSEKARLLGEYSSDTQRRAFIEQYIARDLLYRHARETGLAKDKDTQNELREMEKAFLASKAMEKEYRDQVKITPTDIEAYFEANKEKYKKDDEKEPDFNEARDQAALDLRQEKERDVQNMLLEKLREKYSVVIHNSALTDRSGVEK